MDNRNADTLKIIENGEILFCFGQSRIHFMEDFADLSVEVVGKRLVGFSEISPASLAVSANVVKFAGSLVK